MLVLAFAPALTPTASILLTFDYRRDLTNARRGLYYIYFAILSVCFRWLRKRMDERVIHERVVHNGYIVEGLTVLWARLHVVYH